MKTAILLAAGRGTKCWPYNVTQQKAALPLANKPIICWQVEKLKTAGIENFIVVVGYRQEQVRHALSPYDNISFVEQTGHGTVDAVLSAVSDLQDERFLVMYGDIVLRFDDISNFIKNQNHDAVCSMIVHSLKNEQPQDWMCAQVKDDQVERVVGHPRDDVTHRVCGLFSLSKTFLPYLKQTYGAMRSVQVGMMPPDEAQLEDAIQIAIESRESVDAIETRGLFFDIDKPWHYLHASYDWNAYICSKIEKDVICPGCNISDGADISGRLLLGDHVEIGKGTIIEGNAVVGANTKLIQGAILEKNCVIGQRTTIRRYSQIEHNTTIGDDCFVGHAAEVAGLLLHRVYAYHYGEFWGIIGDNSDLGAATVCGNLRFDDLETLHRVKGRRELPHFGANAAYLGDYVRTGVNTIIMPGAKVGPYSVIGAGTMISGDVPERQLVFMKQEHEIRDWGPEKYGW